MKSRFWGCLLAANATLFGQTLMTEPLGNTTEPKMTLFLTTFPPGQATPPHQHNGVVFIYVLEGAIESQIEPGEPEIFRPGEFFHERAAQMHRVFRNVSATEPVKYLSFSNIDTQRPVSRSAGKQAPPAANANAVRAQVLLQESLKDLVNQEVSVIKITTAPGATVGPHQHPGPVFAYLLRGEVESQVEPGEPEIYRAGDVFYEPPMRVHRSYRNLSKTEPAELLIFQVREKGKTLAVAPN